MEIAVGTLTVVRYNIMVNVYYWECPLTEIPQYRGGVGNGRWRSVILEGIKICIMLFEGKWNSAWWSPVRCRGLYSKDSLLCTVYVVTIILELISLA